MAKLENLALLGMSNSGKSYFAERFTRFGFEHVEIDAKIGKELGCLTRKQPGSRNNLEEMARWMGYPWESRYAENSETYLALEETFTAEMLDKIKRGKTGLVLDLTGSVIYLKEETLQKISELTTVVLLDTPQWAVEAAKKLFFDHPKPIYWGKAYIPQDGEEPMDALRRCYPALLAWRNVQYERLAHVTIPREVYRAPGFTEVEMLQFIAKELKRQKAARVKA